MGKDSPWVCPRCGRQFNIENQAHPCGVYLVEDRFAGRPPQVKEAFDYLVGKLEETGPVYVDAAGTSISLAAKSHFATINPQKSSFNLEFLYNKPIQSPRIFKERKIDDQYVYQVKVGEKEDVDGQLLSWLREAYFLKS